ncbi:MAG TPA: substrate-binding domain-containing protein, partial [Burkholderiaceae bacterium]|nr:substrate-binding domain-containing protein [Burkholderiaceae bacterium]
MRAQQANELQVLSAGAAQGLVEAMAPRFLAQTGVALCPTFGAVGAIREKLAAGTRCDTLILTKAVVDQLALSGKVVAKTRAALGSVRTGIGVRKGDALPDITSGAALERTLRAATDIFLPDPQRATAGIHFVRVLAELGIDREMAQRLRPCPNGAAAMHALAMSTGAMPIGCTQLSEIIREKGVTLVGSLPKEFELTTVYSIAVCTDAQQPDIARRFAQWLCSEDTWAAREHAGFEV